MKLKKFAALALAGVMAVSMLAGCASKPATSEPTTDEPATTSLSASVVAALDADTAEKVTFTADPALEATVKSAVTYAGIGNAAGVDVTALQKFDSKLASSPDLTANLGDFSGTTSASVIKNKLEDEESTVVVNMSAANATSDENAVKVLAAAIDSKVAAADSGKRIPAKTGVFKYDDNKGDEVTARIEYTYTGSVALVPVTDPATGVVSYVGVFTLVRSANEVKL